LKDIRTLLRTLESLHGSDVVAPLRWRYEQKRAQGIVLLPPPPEKLSQGLYELGTVIWNGKSASAFGLREKELPQHIAIFGRTGSGKTNTAFLLLEQLLKKGKPFLVFDWKQSYRALSSRHPSIQLFTPGYPTSPFSFNPLKLTNIPERSREAYLRHLLSVLLNVYFQDLRLLSVEGAEYLLLRGLDFLKKEKTVFTFQDLYHWVLNYKGQYI